MSLDFLFVKGNVAILSTDRFSKFLHAQRIRSKTEVLEHVLELNQEAISATHEPLKRLHSDAEAVLNDSKMKAFCKQHQIHKTHSPPGQQWKNGDIESEVKQVKQMLQVNARDSPQVPARLWEYNLAHCVLTRNVTPSKRQQYKSAWEIRHSHDSQQMHLMHLIQKRMLQYGTPVVFFRQTGNQKGYVVGLDLHMTGVGYKVFVPETNKVVIAADVSVVQQIPLQEIGHCQSFNSDTDAESSASGESVAVAGENEAMDQDFQEMMNNNIDNEEDENSDGENGDGDDEKKITSDSESSSSHSDTQKNDRSESEQESENQTRKSSASDSES